MPIPRWVDLPRVSYVASSLMSLRLLAIYGLLALPLGPVAAQEEPSSEVFSQSVEVRVVNIDVTAVDRKGRPVDGLTAEDFVLRVDGHEMPIEYFYASHPTGTPPSPGEQTFEEVREEDPTAPRAASREEVLLVLYLDNFWLTPAEQRRVLEALPEFVRAQPAGQRFVVATHDPGIHIRTPVTRDVGTVLAALEALREEPTQGMVAVRQRSEIFDGIASIWEKYRGIRICSDPCECGWREMLALWEIYAGWATNRIEVALGGNQELLAALGGIPERKAILYVASGLQLRPGVDILRYLEELCPRYESEINSRVLQYDESLNLLNVAAQANTSRATFYPLDAAGLRPDSAASVEWSDSKLRPSGLVSRMERANLEAPPQLLADATGGRAIVNANRPLEPLLDLTEDFGAIYSLGFTPPDEMIAGRKHYVEVDLRGHRRGIRLRHRRSYFDQPLEQRLVDRLIAAIEFAAEVNPLGVRANLGEPTPLARNVVTLPVEVTVPVESLTLSTETDGEIAGRFRVFLAARSRRGGRTAIRQEFFDVTPEVVEEGGVAIVVRMYLEPGEYTVGVGVRDETSRKSSYLALETAFLASNRRSRQ